VFHAGMIIISMVSDYLCCRLPDGSLMEITKVYPLDAVFDSPEDVPDDVMFIIFFFHVNSCSVF
jgi:hypothetical protein